MDSKMLEISFNAYLSMLQEAQERYDTLSNQLPDDDATKFSLLTDIRCASSDLDVIKSVLLKFILENHDHISFK